jgi:hypothetical protein
LTHHGRSVCCNGAKSHKSSVFRWYIRHNYDSFIGGSMRADRARFVRVGARILTIATLVVAPAVAVATGAGAVPTTINLYVGTDADNTAAITLSTCQLTSNTSCTLRAAIGFAAAAGTGNTANVHFTPATAKGPIVLTDGTLSLITPATVVIAGNGTTKTVISGNGTYEIFDVEGASPSVSLSSMTLENANSGGNGGGAVYNSAKLSLRHVNMINNVAGASGGAIYNDGTLAVSGGTYANNTSTSQCGGLAFQQSTTSVSSFDSVSALNNTSDCGGAFNDSGGTLTVTRSLIKGNFSRDYDDGGGVVASGSTASVSLTNDTLVGNVSLALGGAVAIDNAASGTLVNNTIVGNDALQGGGGVSVANGASAQLTANILSGNTEFASPRLITNQCAAYGHMNSNGMNVVGPQQDPACVFNSPGDKMNANVLLGPLANNGGPTLTMSPLAGSPALLHVPENQCVGTDQRGVARPSAGAAAPCDAGSVEVVPGPAAVNCTSVSGNISGALTFSGCAPSPAGATSSATFGHLSLTSSAATVTWHSGSRQSLVYYGVALSTPGTCAAGRVEYTVGGMVVLSNAPSVHALTKVALRLCKAASGSMSLAPATKAAL